jgi:hypothetical protein
MKRFHALLKGVFRATCVLTYLWTLPPAAWALKQAPYHQMLSITLDQADVVRIPNISQQVSHYALVSEVGVFVVAPWQYQPPRRFNPDANTRTLLIPVDEIPSADTKLVVRVGFMGWIGGGLFNPEGRLDGFGSFSPQSIPMKFVWRMQRDAKLKEESGWKRLPQSGSPEFPHAYELTQNSQVHERRYINWSVPLNASIQAMRSELVVVMNGHDLAPIPLIFSGKPLSIPEFRYDGPDRQIWQDGRFYRYSPK